MHQLGKALGKLDDDLSECAKSTTDMDGFDSDREEASDSKEEEKEPDIKLVDPMEQMSTAGVHCHTKL